jgi:D-sedoheptulose 7-phosphate isomerase
VNSMQFQDFLVRAGKNLAAQLVESNSKTEISQGLEVLCYKMKRAIENKGVVFFFGNGGSAAEASHIAAEFTSYCVQKHEPWGAICLNDSVSSLTAIPNDYSFEEIFSRQLKGLVKPGDVVIGLSTSGNSKNVLHGLHEAKSRGAFSVLMTSTRAPRSHEDFSIDLYIRADSSETTRIQEIHLHWLHTIIEFLELNTKNDS